VGTQSNDCMVDDLRNMYEAGKRVAYARNKAILDAVIGPEKPQALTKSNTNGHTNVSNPHREGNRKTRRAKAKAKRKAARQAKQAMKSLRGGLDCGHK